MGDRLMDIPVYLVLVGLVELAALLLVSTLALLRVPAWGWRAFRLRVRRWSVFAALFFVIGCAGNSVFMSLWEIQLVWGVIAAAVWCATVWLYRGYARERDRLKGLSWQ
jgi:hypothetical protein